MRHRDDHDIIGDRPKKTAAPVDELPLWSGAVDCTPAEAAATLEARFVRPAAAPADPQPAPRAKDETQAFAGDGPVSDVELDKPFNRTPAGKCVIGHLKQAEVPAFAGPAQKASTIVTIAVAGK